ncbi:WD40 repeat domain-containing serine/threonine protein kinase [Streptomyces katrae]|uniref:WD40 repeat domain-containing serine/threonine protein kinase n=1 Tax=Streptomyces katrae TaxID=68223 RepID=UPI0009A50129|nr:serine/threonine-protein kinase [Streptomyces katrae]
MRAGEELAGRYRLDVRLGQGGVGEVWRAQDLELGRAVAVKVLLEFDASEEQLGRFRREAEIGARLRHPGITVVHDTGRHGKRLFIVMELLEGMDLAQRLAAHPGGGLPLPEVLDLGLQAAEALAAAHAQQVVHRDLKPANLFLLTEGRLKICDFGIARTAHATASLTATGHVFGTPAYMAPEQWRGERVGASCDMYALGGVLHALSTGAPPFPVTETPWVLMRRHLDETAPALDTVRADVPAPLAELVAGLLAKDPRARPDAPSAAGRLRALLATTDARVPTRDTGAPPPDARPLTRDTQAPPPDAQVPPPGPGAAAPDGPALPPGPPGADTAGPTHHAGPPDRPGPRPERRGGGGPTRRTVLLGGLGAAGAAGGAYAALRLTRWSGGGAGAGGGTAGPRAGVVITHHTDSVGSVAFSPDGRFLASGSSDRTVRLWNMAAASGSSPFRARSATVTCVAFSPDGKVLASAGLDRAIALSDVERRSDKAELKASAGVLAAVFSPDGTLLADADDRTVRLWDLAAGTVTATLDAHGGTVRSVAFSPDGRTLASGGEDGAVRLWDVTARSNTATLTGHTAHVASVAFSPDGRTLASGGGDTTIRLWDPATAAATATLTGSNSTVRSVAFSPDGRTLAGGGGRTVRLWDVATRTAATKLNGHTGAVTAVAFSPDGVHLASGSEDSTVRIWRIS